jgi:SAM-dependent methyltransferase
MDEHTAHLQNRRVYDSSAMAALYAGTSLINGLLPAERTILERLEKEAAGRAILDIGVGGGRTVPYLYALAGQYLGIDYAAAMIRQCRAQFPGIDFRQADATNMSELAAASFDMVWFTFNGIDYVFAEDRWRILHEVHRVLRPGGWFVFSSHNLNARPGAPNWWPPLVFTLNPWRLARRNLGVLRRHLLAPYHYRRNKPHESQGPGYAVVVDQAHDYRLLTFYISAPCQVAQLRKAGFTAVEVVGHDGWWIGPDQDPADEWLYYVARKPTSAVAQRLPLRAVRLNGF